MGPRSAESRYNRRDNPKSARLRQSLSSNDDVSARGATTDSKPCHLAFGLEVSLAELIALRRETVIRAQKRRRQKRQHIEVVSVDGSTDDLTKDERLRDWNRREDRQGQVLSPHGDDGNQGERQEGPDRGPEEYFSFARDACPKQKAPQRRSEEHGMHR